MPNIKRMRKRGKKTTKQSLTVLPLVLDTTNDSHAKKVRTITADLPGSHKNEEKTHGLPCKEYYVSVWHLPAKRRHRSFFTIRTTSRLWQYEIAPSCVVLLHGRVATPSLAYSTVLIRAQFCETHRCFSHWLPFSHL